MSTGLDENQLDRPQSAPRPPSAQPQFQATLDQGVQGRILNPRLNMVQSCSIYHNLSCFSGDGSSMFQLLSLSNHNMINMSS